MKKEKLEKTAKIRRRLMKLWSEKVRFNNQCAICGLKSGDMVNEKVQKIDAHHIEHRSNAALRFDFLNGIPLCVWHHKFGKDLCAHRSLSFYEWLLKNRPKQYQHILDHRKDEIDLNDRETLLKIEEKLKANISEEESDILNSQEKLNKEG